MEVVNVEQREPGLLLQCLRVKELITLSQGSEGRQEEGYEEEEKEWEDGEEEESENEGEEDRQEKEKKENRWGKQRSRELAWKPVEADAMEGWSFMFHFVEKRGLRWRQSWVEQPVL